jgi:hypothetical protein
MNLKENIDKKKENNLKKYGVDSYSKTAQFKKKFVNTCREKYGVDYPQQSEKIKSKSRLSVNERYGGFGMASPLTKEKIKKTMMNKYGVPNAYYLSPNSSIGKRISKFQRREYEQILTKYPDAKLEEYLPDVQKSVDIYIPSQRKIVECFGDFWHCNPEMYDPEYYHKYVHMNASEIWKRDEDRIKTFRDAGYQVEVVWENTQKQFKHVIEC